MPDEPNRWYIRVRGRVLGPFDTTQLRKLRALGQFSRANEVSTDRLTWQPATDIEHLFAAIREKAVPGKSSDASREAAPPAAFHPKWFYAIGTEQYGPVTTLELRGLMASGKLSPQDLVWKEGMTEWMPVVTVAELKDLSTRPGELDSPRATATHVAKIYCTTCGAAVDVRAEICPQCGIRLDSTRSMTARIQAIETSTSFAGFWKRTAAYLIDSFIMNVFISGLICLVCLSYAFTVDEDVMVVILHVVDPILELVHNGAKFAVAQFHDLMVRFLAWLFPWWLYYAIMESSPLQGTLGKLAVAVRVTDLDGRRISFGRATARFYSKLLCWLIGGVGFLLVAFTKTKQGLHDTISGCLVVNRY